MWSFHVSLLNSRHVMSCVYVFVCFLAYCGREMGEAGKDYICGPRWKHQVLSLSVDFHILSEINTVKIVDSNIRHCLSLK